MKRSFFLATFTACSLFLASGPARADELQDAGRMFKEGQYPAALTHVNAYLQQKPKDPQGRFLKGLILTEENKIPEATRVFADLSEDYPELPEPYNNLAVLYAAQGQYDKARVALESAIKTHPSYATAHENLGDIYAKMASQAYDKALQLDQGNAKVQTKLELIKELFSVAKAAQATKPVKTAKAEPEKKAPPAHKEVPQAAGADSEVMAAVQTWAKAWSAQDVAGYLASYSPSFSAPDGEDLDAWKAERKARIEKPKMIEVQVVDAQVTLSDATHASVSFRQNYRASNHRDSMRKVLTLVKTDGKWLIDSEKAAN